jgi:molecular chaperone GrpE
MHASESENAEPDINNQDEEKTESPAAPADPLAQAEADLKAARAEAAEWQDRFLRKAAELENFRKRADKEKVDAMTLAKGSLLLEFLPVADACERALQSMEIGQGDPGELEQYREGVELLYKQLLDTFNRSGVVPIESEGKPFDPHLHEALSRQEDPNYEVDTVVQELRRGYRFKEKLLRPAQVIVAVQPAAQGEESR